MGYWSIFQSVDYMDDHCNYEVAATPDEALASVEQAVGVPGRVTVERTAPDEVTVMTLQHTPAWAFLGLFPLLFVRKNRSATITVTPHAKGSVVHARGRLDARAATRVRQLQTR